MGLTNKQKNLILFITIPLVFILGLTYFFWPGDRKANYQDLVEELEKDPKNRNLYFMRPRDRSEYFENQQKLELNRANRPYIYKSTADEYRARAQYPHYSEPIPVFSGKPVDPLVEDTDIIPAKVIHPKKPEGPFMFHYIEKNNYEPVETVAIHAFMSDGNDKLETDKLTATLIDLSDRTKGVKIKKEMLDDGRFKDTGGDKIYTATFSTRNLTKVPHNYSLIIKYDEFGEYPITATNAFTFGKLNIELGKEFEDAIDPGEKGNSLLIRAKVKVEEDGVYWAQASLYSDDGKPIGRAQTRQEFTKGEHWLELRWYGKLFCDAQKNGPYKLRYLMLANVKQMPGPRSGRLEDLYETFPYEHKQFTCESFDDPTMINKAQAIEEEIKEIISTGE